MVSFCVQSFSNTFRTDRIVSYEKSPNCNASSRHRTHRHWCSCLPTLGAVGRGSQCECHVLGVYFDDPFLAFAYAASIPFFVGLYQTFKALGYASQKTVSSKAVLRALRIIKFCAMVMIICVVIGEIWIMSDTSDDRAGGVFMGVLITIGSISIAFEALRFERMLRCA